MDKTWRSAHFNEIVRRTLDASNPTLAAQFRTRLLEDPDGLIAEEGYDLTEEEYNILKNATKEAMDRTAEFVAASASEGGVGQR